MMEKRQYIVAEHVAVRPKDIPSPIIAECVVGIDPGERNIGIAIWTPEGRQTFRVYSDDFLDAINGMLQIIEPHLKMKNSWLVVEGSYILVPTVVFIWQVIGILRYLYPSQVWVVTPTEARAKGLGKSKLTVGERKRILKDRGWEKLKTDHEVAAAIVIEWFLHHIIPSSFKLLV